MSSWTVRDAQEVGERIGIDWVNSKFDPQDLLEGMNVELEHGTALDPRVNVTDDDAEKTAKIAWAHLLESPDYYVYLRDMELLMEQGDEMREASIRTAAERADRDLEQLADALMKLRTTANNISFSATYDAGLQNAAAHILDMADDALDYFDHWLSRSTYNK